MKNLGLNIAFLMLATIATAGCTGKDRETADQSTASSNGAIQPEPTATDTFSSSAASPAVVAQDNPPLEAGPQKATATNEVAAAQRKSTFPWPTDDVKAEVAKPQEAEREMVKSKKLDLVAMFPQWAQAEKLTGDDEAGREIYTRIGLDSPFSCQACHSFDERDTLEVDALGLVRVGHPIYAASHRTNIKNSGTGHAALGGNICVLHFFQGTPPGMDAQELANLDAFLKSGGDASHPTAQNLPYDKMAHPAPPAVLTGGEAAKGKIIAMTRCVSCHGIDDIEAKYGEVGIDLAAGDSDYLTLEELALRIRNPDGKNNDYMPGFSNVTITDEQLVDLLAWLTVKK